MKNKVPPADIILGLLNNKKEKEDELLIFYDSYIKAASFICLTSVQQNISDYDEDLAQEMRLNLIKSVPVLRKRIIRLKSSDHSLIVLVL